MTTDDEPDDIDDDDDDDPSGSDLVDMESWEEYDRREAAQEEAEAEAEAAFLAAGGTPDQWRELKLFYRAQQVCVNRSATHDFYENYPAVVAELAAAAVAAVGQGDDALKRLWREWWPHGPAPWDRESKPRTPRPPDTPYGPHTWTLVIDPETGKPAWQGYWVSAPLPTEPTGLEPGEALTMNPFYFPPGTTVVVTSPHDAEFYRTGVFAPELDDDPPPTHRIGLIETTDYGMKMTFPTPEELKARLRPDDAPEPPD